MSKRKFDITILTLMNNKNNNYRLYQYYNNPTNDVISLYDNHIYFSASITYETISKLIIYSGYCSYIHLFNNKTIYY